MLERKDGTRVPFLTFPSLLRDGNQKVIGAVNMMVDISERRQAEERQKSLIDELNHRVKNTLTTVQSLAANTAREASVPPAMRQAFEGRLIALSRTHDQLTRTGWQTADLSSVIREIFAPYLQGLTDRIMIAGEPVKLAPRQALALAMVFNELAANALRHGSLSVANGQLRLDCGPIWHAANVVQALAILAQHRPDVALLDVNLGKEKVFPVADMLIERAIPFIFSTGYGRDGLAARMDGSACHPEALSDARAGDGAHTPR